MATREDIGKGVKAPGASVKDDGSPTCPPRIVRLEITPTPSQHKAASPSPAALAVTARVRELREAEEQDRRDRQVAAIAKLLYRAAEQSRRDHRR